MKSFEYNKSFSVVDIVLFSVVLGSPTFIGLYFAYKDRSASTTKRYFFGGKNMHPIAVGISTAVTSISAMTMIGYPVEVYFVGTVFFWAPLAIITAAIVAYIYYVPFYSNLQMDTVYHYLERRFNVAVKRTVALMILVSEIFYMGSTIYLPAVALSAVAPIEMSWSIAMIGGICTFYTVLGGMAAVVWTDVMQSIFMILASVMLFIFGTNSVGGINELSSSLERGERDTFTKFDNFHISSRMHPVALFIGEFFVFTHYLGFAQPIYQRILSCKNVRKSQQSIISYVIPAMIIICISIGNGLLLYPYFEGCDLVKSGAISKRDQMIPFMAAMEFKNIRGVTGIFVASVFTGTLRNETLPIAALILGICVIVTAYLISTATQNAFKLIRCFVGSINGSVLGIFLLGIFVPWTNSAGAIVGGVFGYMVMIWIFVGSNFLLQMPSPVALPPTGKRECMNVTNVTTTDRAYTKLVSVTSMEETFAHTGGYGFDQLLYSLNFHYYVLTGCIITMVVGLAVSVVTGRQKSSEADPTLFMPILDNPCFPNKIKKFFRCGVPEKQSDNRLEIYLDKMDRTPLKEESV